MLEWLGRWLEGEGERGGGGTNHSGVLGSYWMNRVVALVELFSSGLSWRMCIDSAVRRSSLLEWEDSIVKLSEENGWSVSWEWSRIEEWEGRLSWAPVLTDLPRCSNIRCCNQREVDPTYLA